MANQAGKLTVELELAIARFVSDMGKAQAVARRESQEMANTMRRHTKEARESVDLLAHSIGVQLPREMKKMISETTLIGPALSAALKLSALSAGVAVIAEYSDEIAKLARRIGGLTEEMEKADKAASDFNHKLLTQFETLANGRHFINDTNRALAANAAIQQYYDKRNLLKEGIAALASGNMANLGETIFAGKTINDLKSEEIALNGTLTEQLKQLGVLQDNQNKQTAEAAKKRMEELKQNLKKQRELYLQAFGDAAASLEKIEREFSVSAEKARTAFLEGDLQDHRNYDATLLELTKERNRKILDEQKKLRDEIAKMQPEMFPLDLRKSTPKPNVKLERASPYEVELETLRRSASERAKEAADVFKQTRTQAEQYRFEIDKLNILLKEGAITQQEYNRRVGQLKLTMTPLGNIIQAAVDGFGRMFEGVILGTQKMSDAFRNMAQTVLAAIAQMIAKMLAMWAVQKLTGLIFPGSSIDFKTGSITFGGKRASGGPVAPGAAFLVGERGPEVFVPNTAGRIIPNGGGMGGNIFIDARGADAGVEHRIYRVVKEALRVQQGATLMRFQDQMSRA